MGARSGVFALAVLVALAVACAKVQMHVPSDVAETSNVLEVRGRGTATGMFADESFKLGVYDVTHVDRKGDTSESSDFVFFSSEETTNGYSYLLTQGRAKLKGSCRSKVGSKDDLLSHKEYSKLGCACTDGVEKVRVSLDNSGAALAGKLVIGAGTFSVSTITDVEGVPFLPGPAGYRVDGDKPIGAVDVLSPGRAWVGKSLGEDDRMELACLFAGLLLYIPPEPPPEESK